MSLLLLLKPRETSLYSRENKVSLPTVAADLGTYYSTSELSDVLADDNIRVGVSGTSGYLLHQFKYQGANNTSPLVVSWNGQSDVDATESTIYLQIYNYNTSSWETLDSNDTSAADTDFTLYGIKNTSVTNYYDGSNIATFRVYQQII